MEKHAEARLKSGTGFLKQAIELAERGRGTTHPNPVVGAVVVRDGDVVGEGWHECKGGPHAEIVALEAGAQNEAWRTWVSQGRPFVTYKAAMTLDGRLTIPGERWISGEESRRLVHRLRADSDAVAVGMGTVRADAPRLDARDVAATRQPRRLAFGKGPLPEGSELELRAGPLADELTALADEGVQSLLLEGGPTLAAAFFREDLVDKVLVFVAPKVSGEGPALLREPVAPGRRRLAGTAAAAHPRDDRSDRTRRLDG